MALTKVSTDGVKDDAITKSKIPANQIEASELADNAVDTNAIADQAVTVSKIQNVAQDRILGRQSSGSGDLQELNPGNVRLMINVADGANQTTINNNANNRIITGSGTANTLEGEANATFNGDSLGLNSSSITEINLQTSNNTRFKIQAGSNFAQFLTQNNNSLAFKHDGGTGGGTQIFSMNSNGLDIGNNKRIHIHDFYGDVSGRIENSDSTNNSLRIEADPDNTSSGNLSRLFFRVDGSTKGAFTTDGLCFNSDTAAANALDDYEEGTFTPDWRGGQALGTTSYGTINSASYTKIGRMVTVTGRSEITGSSGGQGFWFLGNMPFNVNSGGKGFNAVGSVSLESTNFANDTTYVIATMEQNNNNMHIHTVRDNATLGTGVSPSNGAMTVQWTITYQTT